MKIFLIGYMGSGKTTIGKKLATKLQLEFLDLDDLIEEQQEKTISQIFENEDEISFRKYEQQALLSLKTQDNLVIATGGGTPCFFDNISKMNQTGETVFLNIPAKMLATRLNKSKADRPLLKNKTETEVLQFIEKNLKERLPYYEKAKYSISAINLKTEDLLYFFDIR